MQDEKSFLKKSIEDLKIETYSPFYRLGHHSSVESQLIDLTGMIFTMIFLTIPLFLSICLLTYLFTQSEIGLSFFGIFKSFY